VEFEFTAVLRRLRIEYAKTDLATAGDEVSAQEVYFLTAHLLDSERELYDAVPETFSAQEEAQALAFFEHVAHFLNVPGEGDVGVVQIARGVDKEHLAYIDDSPHGIWVRFRTDGPSDDIDLPYFTVDAVADGMEKLYKRHVPRHERYVPPRVPDEEYSPRYRFYIDEF
jgi:hypothetical protein